MERGKMSSTGRGGKSKAPQHPQDIFALGSKSSVVSRDSEKRSIHKPSTSGVERKREAPGFGTQPPGKRSRIGSPAESVAGASLEIDPVDLVPNVLQALDTHNSDKLLGLLTGSIRLLKSQRSKPDPILCMSMLYLTKIRPNMFAHETVTQSLCSLLKREQGAAFKSKGNPLVFVLACNMLYAGHKDNRNWPDTFIKVYIEDALNERWWVDCAWCKCLVENIVTAFNTKLPPTHLIPTDNALGTMSPSGSGSPLTGSTDDDTDVTDLEYSVFPRYSTSYESVEGLVLEAIKEQIQRRAAPDAIGKGFLKLLAATCGFPEIRMISASRLEAWLHSGKLWRAAQELLAYVCCNADATGPTAQRDHEVLAQLARMRLKTKPLQAAYVTCLREMVSESPALLRSVVTHTIYNELSNVRSPNNMAVLAALVQAQPQLVPQAMADSYQELLLRPEEYIRPLRALTRECVRTSRGDAAALVPLARALAQPPPHEPANEVRERAFSAIADLFCLCCLVIASHSKHVPDYKQQICAIQAAAVGWLLETAMPIYRPSRHDYQLALNKIMFVESAETYSKVDNWPPESERAVTYRLCCEAPLPQNTLLRVIFIGLAKELPVAPAEVLELVETLVRRACALPPDDNPLVVDKLEIADYIFQLSQFHPPDNITLPAGYTPPQLAITSLYWRGWSLLTMLCAHNPGTLAPRAAATYPTLRALIDIAITNKPSIEWSNNSQTEAEAERAAILQLESHLAAASNAKLPITEHNCRLLSQLTTLDPLGPARKPPASVLEAFQQSSHQLRLGRLLCRQPALLLELVQRHGTRRAMPWLLHLLQHDQLQLSVLPVQCLCEFLVAGGAWGGAGGAGKAGELAAHLRRTVAGGEEGARAVLHYYLQRLQHAPKQVRQTANRGLKLVLTQTADDAAEMDYNADVSPDEWIDALWRLPHWEALKAEVVSYIREACLVECDPAHLAAYVALLASYVRDSPHVNHNDLVLDLSQVLMERMTVCNYMLPGGAGGSTGAGRDAAHSTLHNLTTIFYHHMQKVRVRESGDAAPEEAVGTAYVGLERLWLRWRGWHATLLAVQAHAHLKLLCAGPSKLDIDQEMYNWLLSIWVGSDAPQAFVPETREEAQLLPPWLRLHLVRSARPQLLEAGLRGLPAHELALYIQTFGMPVPAMSALLSALDACPTSSILRLGVERPYMSQLLRVQRARGASGGQAFASALRLTQPDYPPEDTLFAEESLPMEAAGAWGGAGVQGGTLSLQQVGPLLAGAFGGGARVLPDHAFTTLYAKVQEEANASLRLPAPPCPYTQTVVTFLQQSLLLNSQLPSMLLRGAAQAGPLLRALLPHAHGALASSLHEISEGLLKHYKCALSPIVGILREISQAAGDGVTAPCKREREDQDLPVVPSNASRDQLVAALEAATPNTLEQIGTRIIQSQDTRLVVDVISYILEKNQAGAYDVQVIDSGEVKTESGSGSISGVFSSTGLGCGLMLDWLSELQQETLAPEPQRQMRLMFRSGCAMWRPLLVTQLAHRASWRTLHTCLTTLLEPDGSWAASSVLEFAETLIRSPRVWQGRDKTTPKHHTPEDLLRLRHDQLCVLVRYILQEADTAATLGGIDATRVSIEARLPLLLQCCSDAAALLCACAQHEPTPGGSMLLLLLYMKVPKILKLLTECEDRPSPALSLTSSCDMTRAAAASTSATDVVSHCLLCAIAASSPHVKEQTPKISRLEAGVRALWARHPGAGARALPLVAALLRGSPPRSSSLTYLLAALEMVPDDALFADEHSKELNDIVECLMSHAATTSGGGGGSAALVHRVAALMRRYIASKPQRAQHQLHSYRAVVASVPALSGLIAAGGDAAPSSALPPPHALTQLQQRRDNPEDLHWPLQEIEAWGTRRGGAWGGLPTARAILRAAAPLLAAPHEQVRGAALSLLVKLLPAVDDTKPALQAILECLESSQAELVQSVLGRLGELVCGMQGDAHQVLLQVFSQGVRARLPADQALAKCVSTINLLRGC